MAAAAASERSYVRRKSPKSLVIALKLSPTQLQSLASGSSPASTATPRDDTLTPNPIAVPSTSTPDGTASDANTPVPSAAGAASMPPPTDGRKKGTKRKSDVLGADGVPKVRGKPGPKKKIKLDDGSDPKGANAAAAHKLGPKANLGAINAGLRALDRSGKPTRKWHKNGFVVKSFTGVVWEVNRWKAPPKLAGMTGESEGSGSISGVESGSGKENKESTAQSEKSAALEGEDTNMANSAAVSINASSPAPVIAASA